MLKKSKKNKSKLPSISLIIIGLILMFIPFVWKMSETDLSFSSAPNVQNYNISSIQNKPTQINIPKLNLNLNIEEGNVINNKWQISKNGVTHYMFSAVPGAKGNIVIYGHNDDEILGKLDKLSKGDFINIYSKSGKLYSYSVGKIITVTPDQVEVISPSNIEELTLYTCVGFFDSKRLVIKAYPVELVSNNSAIK